jgi:hypothetical protein
MLISREVPNPFGNSRWPRPVLANIDCNTPRVGMGVLALCHPPITAIPRAEFAPHMDQ